MWISISEYPVHQEHGEVEVLHQDLSTIMVTFFCIRSKKVNCEVNEMEQ